VIIDRECPICGSKTTPAGSRGGSRSNRVYHVRRCIDCGYGYVENPWTEYEKIYDETYYRGLGSDALIDYAFEFENPELSVRSYEWDAWHELVHHHFPDNLKWLDVGCGCGSLVSHAHERDYDTVFGYDTGTWAIKAKEAGVPILNTQELIEHEGTFDVITAVDVIEHISDPCAALKSWRKLLKKGGRLFVVTQNAHCAPTQFIQWSYIEPEIHVSFFTPEALALAYKKSGFSAQALPKTNAWYKLLRARILKNLKIKQKNRIEAAMPWWLLSRLADWKLGMSAMPLGIAE
jgi:2-polyprenyl-3-methyl-5-hydroxy-6-metoxy-1,4-benzoquinol methylase